MRRSTRRSPVKDYSYLPRREPLPRRSSPLRYEEEKELVLNLKDIMKAEKDLETRKIELSLRSDFNLVDAFRIFDTNGRGWITLSELRNGLNSIGLYPSISDSELVFKRFDINSDGVMKFSEFCDVFTPKSAEYSSVLNHRKAYFIYKPYYRIEEYFEPITREHLRDTARAHIETEVLAEALRQHQSRNPYFNLLDAFKTCDIDASGYISTYEIKALLESHGIYSSTKDVSALVDRYDKNKDGRISYSEFVSETKPKSPERKRLY